MVWILGLEQLALEELDLQLLGAAFAHQRGRELADQRRGAKRRGLADHGRAPVHGGGPLLLGVPGHGWTSRVSSMPAANSSS